MYQYEFRFENGDVLKFAIEIDNSQKESALVETEKPSWIELEYSQCPNCPLDKEKSPVCPVALKLRNAVETFKQVLSYERAEILVTAPERTYVKTGDVQTGLQSL